MALSGKRNWGGFWNIEFSREDDVDEDHHSDGFGKVFVQLCFVLPLLCHILWLTLGFVDMRSSWPLWIPKVIHWSFVYLEFLIPCLDARSSILVDFFHLYNLRNGSPFSLVVCSLLGRIILDPFEEILPKPRLVFGEVIGSEGLFGLL